MTTEQFRNRTKTVTRRFGWWFLKPGDVVQGVEKSMGLKKGEKIKPLGLIRIVSTRREPLNAITEADLVLESMPETSPREFVELLCSVKRVPPDEPVNRIEYEYID